MKIAVIGSGISGLIAADLLSQRHQVVLFEKEDRVGGHTNTILLPREVGGSLPVDAGWIIHHGFNNPNLTALLSELGVQTRNADMSFSVSLGNGAYEYKRGARFWSLLTQPSNLLSWTHLRMLMDVLRLRARCLKIFRNGESPTGSLGEFLETAGLSPALASRYVLPMAGMIWNCSPLQASDYPAADFMRFFQLHFWSGARRQPTWRTVIGGSNQYIKPILSRFKGELRTATPVISIKRNENDVIVRTNVNQQAFDQVICATHSDQTLKLLSRLSKSEHDILSGVPYSASRCVLHTDERFLPKRRAAWASLNYLNELDEVHDRPISGSYWINRLQGISGGPNYIVTLNPRHEIPPQKILYQTIYEHPLYGPASVETRSRLPEIQGRRRTWFAGAWTQFGFHEDGLTSGLRVVNGIDKACMPTWAAL